MATLLGLPDSPRKRVFRRIVAQLRNDPVLQRALNGRIFAWEGRPTDSQPLAPATQPGLRLTPTFGPDIWAFPDAFRGWMYIGVDIIAPGFDVGDMLDLFWAVQVALYPPPTFGVEPSPAQRFQQQLKDAGAYTGLIEFSLPAADDSPSDLQQGAQAQMKIEMMSVINV
jgi:hypothetical protein